MVTGSNDNHRLATIAASQTDSMACKSIALHCGDVMRNAGVRPAIRGLRSNRTHATNGAGKEGFGPE